VNLALGEKRFDLFARKKNGLRSGEGGMEYQKGGEEQISTDREKKKASAARSSSRKERFRDLA